MKCGALTLLATVAVVVGQHATARESSEPQIQAAWAWDLPSGFRGPEVPADNPMTAAKVDLGRHLFYDLRLSGNGAQSCASCHQQDKAFTDGLPKSMGSTGETHPRGSMSLVNVGYARVLTWGSSELTSLEDQALVPMFGHHPVELGLDDSGRWLAPIESDPTYRRLFAAAFPETAASTDRSDRLDRDRVVKAIAAFERAIVSMRSPYDRYHFERDDAAVSAAAKRGEVLFHSQSLSCFTCHGGVHFSGAMVGGERSMTVEFHNTGLYNLAGELSYPRDNLGLYELTHDAKDVGKFKAPTLRNIAVTAPYMHDGSVASLEEAIDHYAAGGRTIESGPYQGVGRDNPVKSATLRGFTLTAEQRADLVAFLESLTDEALLHDPRFANPWPATKSR